MLHLKTNLNTKNDVTFDSRTSLFETKDDRTNNHL